MLCNDEFEARSAGAQSALNHGTGILLLLAAGCWPSDGYDSYVLARSVVTGYCNTGTYWLTWCLWGLAYDTITCMSSSTQ